MANVIFKPNLLFKRQFSQAVQISLEQTAEAIHTDLIQEQTMPWLTGRLQGEGTFVDISDAQHGTVYITSSTPYARRLYFHPEYHFNTTENPSAGGEWFKPYTNGPKIVFVQETFAKLLKRNGGL